MAKIPFQATAPKTFSLLPKGTYLLRIEDVTEGESKAGNPQLTVAHVIESDDQYNGRKVTRWFPIGGAGGFRLRGLAEAAIPDKIEITETGEEDEKGNPIATVDMDTDDLIGALYYADCIIKNDPTRGEQNDWRNERPYEATAAESEDAEEVEEEEGEEEESESAEDVEEPAKKPETKKTSPAPTAAASTKKTGSATAKVNDALKGNKTAAPANGGGRQRERMRA